MSKSAIVIGAGIGGLTAAMKLAHDGWRVEVHEKLAIPGGRCSRLEVGGFKWDYGPTILLMPFVLEKIFASVGRKLSEVLTLRKCEPNYQITWRDGSTLTLTTELTKLRAELERLEPGSFERFLKFLAKGQVRHDVGLERFVNQHFSTVGEFLTLENLPDIFRVGAHQKLFPQVAKAFRDPRLQQAMSFSTMYLGVSPYEAPAVFSLLPYTEMAVGLWYSQGGIGELAHALHRICVEEGVDVRYKSNVKRVLIENGRAVGVELAGGAQRRADVVICNADYPWAKKHLLETPAKELAALEKRRYTASGYMLYWGVKRRYEQLQQHNMFLGNDFEGSFENIFEKGRVPEDPSFYVNAPAHLDPTMAPEGKDALYVLVPVPNTAAPLDWKVEGPKVRGQVLARLAELGMPDLEKDLEVERIVTPDDWRTHFSLERGANFGLSQNMFQIGPFRPKVFDDRIGNLFYCGASVQPGTGVPTVMISAELMIEQIEQRAVFNASAAAVPALTVAPAGEQA